MENELTLDNIEYISKTLSVKSQEYILNDLFATSKFIDKFLNKRHPLTKVNPEIVIGTANQTELQLFVIHNSLYKRIRGTRERIHLQELYLEDEENPDKFLMQRLQKSYNRRDNLIWDYWSVFNHLCDLVEERLLNEMELVVSKNSLLEITRYNCGGKYSDGKSGYVLEITNTKEIFLQMRHPPSGD